MAIASLVTVYGSSSVVNVSVLTVDDGVEGAVTDSVTSAMITEENGGIATIAYTVT